MWPFLVSSALAQTSPFFNVTCTPDGPLADLGPIEVECSVAVQEDGEGDPIGTWGTTSWLMGDGTALKGDVVTHTYTESGVFTISVELDDFALAGDTGLIEVPGSRTLTRLQGFYTVCGDPMPEFEIVDKGGLRYDVVNRTPVDQPRCLRTLDWTVKRDGRSRPLFSFDNWEPSFELPEEGTYVVSVAMVAIGGEAKADVVLDAEYNLTSDYYRTFARACSTAPTGGALGLLVLLAFAAGRRERR